MTTSPRKTAAAKAAAEKPLERPNLNDAYGELTYDDDVAIREAFDVDVDDLFGQLGEEGSRVYDLWLAVRVLEFVRCMREDGLPAHEAAHSVKALTKNRVGELLDAYTIAHAVDADSEDPDSDEGKGDAAAS